MARDLLLQGDVEGARGCRTVTADAGEHMITLIRSIRKHGLWRVSGFCLVLALAIVGVSWGVVEAFGLHPLYVRLAAVIAFMGLPMLVGLAWAIGAPQDASGKGNVVR